MKPSLSRRSSYWEAALAALHPEDDAELIMQILAQHVFPLEYLLALEIAQLRTFTIPSISKILHATRQYEQHGVKRLDDTKAILAEVFRHGLDSEESREMVGHLNRIHSLYPITNDDYIYTLSTFIIDPALFIERYGHRPMRAREKQAVYATYRRLGDSMGIVRIPPSYDTLLQWRQGYERRCQRYSSDNEAVARGLLAAAATMLPGMTAARLEPLIVALVDDEAFRQALGFAAPSRRFQWSVASGRELWQRVSRRLNPFEEAGLWSTAWFNHYETYPRSYDRMRLGPTKVLAMLEARAPRR